MTTTLSRRIRRIGILPTTYKEIKEETLGHDETGAEVAVVKVKKVPVRHFSKLPIEQKQSMAAALRTEAKVKRVAARKATKK